MSLFHAAMVAALAAAASLVCTPLLVFAQKTPAVVAAQRGTVAGRAEYRDRRPVPQARLRLRDLTTGRAVALTQADSDGRFTFGPVAAGRYLVELVDQDGRVLAVGESFVLPAGETVTTVVQLGSDNPWYSAFFGNAARAALAAAAALGIAAMVAGDQPASPAF